MANLLLARGVSRLRESGIRASLGATRRRIVRQLLIESALLTTIAAAIGLLVSSYAIRIVSTVSNIYINFLQKGFSERSLEASSVSIHVNGDTAWLVFDWAFTATSLAGQPITSKGWESHVYRRTPRGWVLIALHYSVPPPHA